MGYPYQNQGQSIISYHDKMVQSASLATVVFLASCQPMLGRSPQQAGNQPLYQPTTQAAYGAELNALQPAAGAQPLPLAPYPGHPSAPQPGLYQGYGTPMLGTLEGNQIEFKQRLERIEQALLRLDKRMQLVERNELGRMGSAAPNYGANTGLLGAEAAWAQQPLSSGAVLPSAPLAQTVRQTLRAEELAQGGPTGQTAWNAENWGSEIAPQAGAQNGFQTSAQADGYQPGFAPVSSQGPDTTIRGTLQAAPHSLVGNRLPSLADGVAAAGRIPQSVGSMAIWTVRYEPEKIWPDRAQLPASREVVELLRNSQTVTLVARGPNPSKPEFQERVRALSRYLAKVASLETLPISTLATPQLDGNTIEVLATP